MARIIKGMVRDTESVRISKHIMTRLRKVAADEGYLLTRYIENLIEAGERSLVTVKFGGKGGK